MKINLALVSIVLLMYRGLVFCGNWSEIVTTGNVPELKNSSAVYDAVTNKIFVFGGRTITGISAELWALDLSSNNWNKLLPAGTGPQARYTANALLDSSGRKIIIWSGQVEAGALYNDVWEYDINANSWALLWTNGNTSGAPLQRYGTASVFDPISRQVVNFAGFTTSGRFEDSWSFNIDSMKWQDRTQAVHPPKRCLHSVVYLPSSRRMIIYAGQQTGPLDDIWSLDLNQNTWTDLTPPVKPSPRFWNSTVTTGETSIIIFGGLNSPDVLQDMWKFNLSSNSWEMIVQGSPVPPARWGHSAVYIKSQDRMIIFGGEGSVSYKDTWQYVNAGTIGIQNTGNSNPVKFLLPRASTIRVSIYDVSGKLVNELTNGTLSAGNHSIVFDASTLATGVYFCKLEFDGGSITRKMAYVR